jgi:hypothetical protein
VPIATEKLLYVHMPKTGGLWVAKVLEAVGGSKVPKLHRHCFAGDVPESWTEGRLMFGTIRDPWSWYVSLWRHLSVGRDGQMLLRHLGGGNQSFEAFLRGATDPAVWCQTPNRYTQAWWDWPVGGDGLWSETFRSIYGHQAIYEHEGCIPEVLIDTAQLTEGLTELLGTDVSRVPRQNTAAAKSRVPLGDPKGNYTAELVALVREYDGELAHRIGYDEPFQKLPSALRWGGIPKTSF